MTADKKCSNDNMQKFAQQIQTPLSLKKKTFAWFFVAFLKCAWNLKHFETTDEYPGLIISQIVDSERVSFLNF